MKRKNTIDYSCIGLVLSAKSGDHIVTPMGEYGMIIYIDDYPEEIIKDLNLIPSICYYSLLGNHSEGNNIFKSVVTDIEFTFIPDPILGVSYLKRVKENKK